jgi:predicted transcriptional regulator
MTDTDILERFKPGQRYTLSQLAKRHNVGTSSLRVTLNRMIDAQMIKNERNGKTTVFFVPHAAVEAKGLPAMKPYRLPQVMLDQAARCVDARMIKSKFNEEGRSWNLLI